MSILHQNRAPVNTERTPAHTEIYGHPFMVNGRPSGFMVDRGDYSEWLRNDKDPLRNYPGPGICFDLGALGEAERLGVSIVRIKFPKIKTEYMTHIRNIREHGREFDRGWGRQICLQFGYWTKINADGSITPASLPKTPEPEQPAQLSLIAEPARRNGGY